MNDDLKDGLHLKDIPRPRSTSRQLGKSAVVVVVKLRCVLILASLPLWMAFLGCAGTMKMPAIGKLAVFQPQADKELAESSGDLDNANQALPENESATTETRPSIESQVQQVSFGSEDSEKSDDGVTTASFQQEATEELPGISPAPPIPDDFTLAVPVAKGQLSEIRSTQPRMVNSHQVRASQMQNSGIVPPVVNMFGDQMRRPEATATEISLYQQQVIGNLHNEIAILKADRMELSRHLLEEQRAHEKTDRKLKTGLQEILRLRKLTAKLQVQVDDLTKENTRIRAESDAALQDIEQSLDAALLQEISRGRGN